LLSQEKIETIFVEHNSLLKKTKQVELISYKIPFNNLLFKKNGNSYSTSFTLIFEFFLEDEFILREIVERSFAVDTYEETIGNEFFIQDFFEVDLQPGEYVIKSFFSLVEPGKNIALPVEKIIVANLEETKYLSPLIIENQSSYSEINTFILANYGSKIPFSPKKYSLLFSIMDTNITTISVSIKQLNEEIYYDSISTFAKGYSEIHNNNNKLEVSIYESPDANYFIISDFSHLLFEGKFDIIIKSDSLEKKYSLNTIWFDKPKVLNNPEYSIKLLSYIEDMDILGDLLSSSKDEYYLNLSNYWISKYPANGMKYNYAMAEYYERADYAIKNYSSLNTLDGAERDRGKVYILYGEPTSIKRNYTEMNEVLEVWRYDKISRDFVFKDVNGTGKFDLVE
jgi:GWxTD domain-containing protein